MDGSMGAQYALQIAFQTLKERCQHFQQRISLLEEENVALHTAQAKPQNDADSLSEIDTLKQRITELTEQKLQLQSHTKMVTEENQQLWIRLSKMTQANKSLGSQLTKINDTLTQHNSKQHLHMSPVLRSKTFTIDEPLKHKVQKNLVEENDKLSLELEDISLKLINNIAKEKMELELQCSQMAEIQNANTIISSSFGFMCEEENEEIPVSEVEDFIKNLNNVKDELLQEKAKLQRVYSHLGQVHLPGN